MNDNDFKDLTVVKRSGQRVSFDGTKIAVAIKGAFDDIESNYSEDDVNKVYFDVLSFINNKYSDRKTINVEDIQDIIESILYEDNYKDIYEAFNTYRLRRSASRELFEKKQQHKFLKAIEKFGFQSNNDLLNPIQTLYSFGKSVSCEFSKAYLIENKYVRAHDEGYIYINNLSYYALASPSKVCVNFDSLKIKNINEYLDDLSNIVSACMNEVSDEILLPSFNNLIFKSYIFTYKNILKKNLYNNLKIFGVYEYIDIDELNDIIDSLDNVVDKGTLIFNSIVLNDKVLSIINQTLDITLDELDDLTNLSLNIFFKNIFSKDSILNPKNKLSISFDKFDKITNLFLDIFSCKNYTRLYYILNINDFDNISDTFYDLIRNNYNIIFNTSSKECFTNGIYIDKNTNGESISKGRLLLSNTYINLFRIALMNKNNSIDNFYNDLSDRLDFIKNQMIQRFDLQANKYKINFPNLFKYNLLLDSEKLEDEQKIRKVIKHGLLNIELIGLDECVKVLNVDDSFKLELLNYIKVKIDKISEDNRLNFVFSNTNDLNIRKKLYGLDKSIYGLLVDNYYDLNDNSNCIYLENINDKLNSFSKYINCCYKVKIKDCSNDKIKDIISNNISKKLNVFTLEMISK